MRTRPHRDPWPHVDPNTLTNVMRNGLGQHHAAPQTDSFTTGLITHPSGIVSRRRVVHRAFPVRTG